MKKVLVVDDMLGWRNQHNGALKEIYGDKIQIDVAVCAREGYDKVYNSMNSPYDLIITDLQMESDFEPEYAGEWLVQQIQLLSAYKNTTIVIISAAMNIRQIAERYNVECVPKSTAAQHLAVYQSSFFESALN